MNKSGKVSGCGEEQVPRLRRTEEQEDAVHYELGLKRQVGQIEAGFILGLEVWIFLVGNGCRLKFLK